MESKTPQISRIAGECLAGRVRILNRVVTGVYDDALRPFDVRISQMNILVVVAARGPMRAADVCGRLRLDKSTLSRDLERLFDRGWLQSVATAGRGKQLEATAAGREFIESVAPAWESAQNRVLKLLGPELVQGIFAAVGALRTAEGEGP